MPLVKMEYTSNITFQSHALQELFQGLHNVLVDAVGATLSSCKSRACVLNDFYIGDGDPGGGFILLDIRILIGRSREQRLELKSKAMRYLSEFLQRGEGVALLPCRHLQLRVMVGELDKAYYAMDSMTVLP